MTIEPGGHETAGTPRDDAAGTPPLADTPTGADPAPADVPTPDAGEGPNASPVPAEPDTTLRQDAPAPDAPASLDAPTPLGAPVDEPVDAPASLGGLDDGPTREAPGAAGGGDEPPPVPGSGYEEPRTPPPGAGRPLGGGAFPPPNFPPGGGYPPPGPPPGSPPPPPRSGPSFGTPPPGGWGFAPGTDGWATRYGLARPTSGRVIAGVGAAIGRATNTDPVLWRVLFAVFSLAGGLGIVLYLVGWLVIPAEGDSGSPLEALFGRGRTSTHPVAIIAATVVAAVGLSIVLSQHHFWSIVVVMAILVTLVVVGTRNGNLPGARQQAGQQARYGPPPPPPRPAGYPPAPGAWQAATAPAPPAPGPVPPSYRPPFAPHGPYQPPTRPLAGPGYQGQVPPVAAPPAPRPPRPPKQRSKLGLVTFSLALVAVGVLGLLDVSGVSVPFPAYLAVALGIVGLGMVVGTWFGRARGLIGLGLVLALVLGIAAVTERVSNGLNDGAGDVTWAPTAYADVSDSYSHGFGNATLDLTAVDFAGLDKAVEVDVNAGDVRITLPPDVDVVITSNVNFGNADVFGQHWNGVNTGTHTVSDLGADGAGGGHLTLNVHVNAGSLEVHR